MKCKCGECAVDGGHDYLRRCASSQDAYTELSEIEDLNADELWLQAIWCKNVIRVIEQRIFD